tara:strand:- start:17 stop:409 length:393 start_codon:yes stop_codon:yes gene_type:complete
MRLTDNFSKSEFNCKCGCEMPDDVLDNIKCLAIQLQAIRDRFNASLIINSAYRCPNHNRSIGGVKNSQHVLGKAADIVVKGFSPNEVANTIESMLRNEYNPHFNIGGLGRYNTFTHIDIRGHMARWDNRD